MPQPFQIGTPLDAQIAWDIARGLRTVTIADSAVHAMNTARGVVNAALADHDTAHYGINTGFGALAEVPIAPEQLERLQINLVRSHAAGVGRSLPRRIVRLIMLLRAQVLAAGHSGVRPVVVRTLQAMLNAGVHPIIPTQGSVGASGDLAPLAHLALCTIGEGEAEYGGKRMDAVVAMGLANIKPLTLAAKEGLSLINGTQVMTAIALTALARARKVMRAADIAGALTVEGMLASLRPFDPRIQALRPFPGQARVAENLRNLCANSPLVESHRDCGRVQDPYSLRCMPQVHGSVRDALQHVHNVVAIELNAVTDNPLVFAGADDGAVPEGAVISGGNFHGQPVSMAADFGTIAMTTLCGIAERRVEQLLNPQLSNGLPPFLSRDSGLNSGFMIAQVTAAALVSENKSTAHPASVDSIPSSASREDHVSMGPIAARHFLSVVTNAERVIAIELMCAAQSIDLRAPLTPGTGTAAAWRCIRAVVPRLDEDRVLYGDIEKIADLVRDGTLQDAVIDAVGADRFV